MSTSDATPPASDPGVSASEVSVAGAVPLETAPPAEEVADQSPTMEIPQTILALLAMALCGIVTFIAAARYCDQLGQGNSCSDGNKSEDAFAVASGVLTLVAVIVRLVLTKFGCFMDDTPERISVSVVFAFLLWLWWLCTVGAGTFKGPFKTVQNGYFADWIGFFAASYYLSLVWAPLYGIFIQATVTTEQMGHEQRYAGLLAMFSFIFWLAAVVDCTDDDENAVNQATGTGGSTDAKCDEEYGYAILAGVVSMFVFAIYIPLHRRLKECKVSKWIGYLFVVWWAVATGVTTFDKPYGPASGPTGMSYAAKTGNGYFAAWSCFIVSIMFAMEAGTHPYIVPKAHNADAPASETPSVPTPDAEVAPEVPTDPTPEKETA